MRRQQCSSRAFASSQPHPSAARYLHHRCRHNQPVMEAVVAKIASQVDSSRTSGSPHLQIEILSARGLAHLQNLQSETLQSIQLHVLFKKCMSKSVPVVSNNSNEVIFDYVSSFPIHDNKRDDDSAEISTSATDDQSSINPILIYLTTSSVTGHHQQPVGQSFTRTIIAMAVIDYRMAFM